MNYRQTYEQWLKVFADDPETYQALRAIEGDEKEIEDRFYTDLSFGTAGMRGALGVGTNRMNKYVVRRATRGLADYIRQMGGAQRGVVIAYDSREKSDAFAQDAAFILAANGVKAMLFPSLRPVPVLSFAVRMLGAVAGIVITASHNPPTDNGYKVYWEDGAQMPPERADAVLALIGNHSFDQPLTMDLEDALESGLFSFVDAAVDDAYIEAVKTLAIDPDLLYDYGNDLVIVYTPLHGSGNLPVRRVLAEMGVSSLLVVPEQEAPDPRFPTVSMPNPERAECFDMAIALANRKGADVCFATDPDCDRLGVAIREPNGSFRILTGNQIGCLLLHHILSQKQALGLLPPSSVVLKSIVSSDLAESIAERFSAKMVNTLTGFKFIAEKIQAFEETGAYAFQFGFEESSGYLSSTFVRDKDAVNASLLVAELALSLKRDEKTLWDRLEELYSIFGYCAERVYSEALPGMDGIARRDEIMQKLRSAPPTSIDGRAVLAVRDFLTPQTDELGDAMSPADVLCFSLAGDAKVFVRPSGTEPKIKLYVHVYGCTSEKAADEAAATLAKEAKVLLA